MTEWIRKWVCGWREEPKTISAIQHLVLSAVFVLVVLHCTCMCKSMWQENERSWGYSTSHTRVEKKMRNPWWWISFMASSMYKMAPNSTHTSRTSLACNTQMSVQDTQVKTCNIHKGKSREQYVDEGSKQHIRIKISLALQCTNVSLGNTSKNTKHIQ